MQSFTTSFLEVSISVFIEIALLEITLQLLVAMTIYHSLRGTYHENMANLEGKVESNCSKRDKGMDHFSNTLTCTFWFDMGVELQITSME